MNHSNYLDGKTSTRKRGPDKRAIIMLGLILVLPVAVVGVILLFAPNFEPADGMRVSPLGGDFLQEWVGAKLFAMGDGQRLYDLKFVQTMQHDAALVGFEWPETDYFPMVYPPFYYAALQPLTSLSFPLASKVWAIFSALAFSASGLLLYRCYPPCRRVFGICWITAMFFVPLLNCFNMGQKSTFLLLILSGTFVLLRQGRPFLAGCVFGLIIFKPHFGIVIGLAMLFKGQWRFALGAAGVASIAFGYSWAVQGRLVNDYARVIFEMSDYVQTGGYRLSDAHSLWGAAQLTFGWLPATVVKAIAAGFSLVVVGLLWRVMDGKIETGSPRFAWQFSAMVFAMVLLSPHFYGYDLTILLLPMLLIISSFAPGTWKMNSLDLSLGVVLLGILVLAGWFAPVAGVIAVQPSIFLISATLVLLVFSRSKASSSREQFVRSDGP